MCRLRNIAMRDNQESVPTGQTDIHQLQSYDNSPYTNRKKINVTPQRRHQICVHNDLELSEESRINCNYATVATGIVNRDEGPTFRISATTV